jgi:hypothetical protein
VGSATGGTVTFLSPPANASIVTLLRAQPASQLSTYFPNEPFPSTRVERDFDRLVMQVQQLKEQLGRALTFQKSSALTGQGIDAPTAGLFARAKSGGGIEWATPTNAGALSTPVGVADGGTGATTAAGARANLLNYTEQNVIDAKGDLLVGQFDNALTRLPVSSVTGMVLTTDPLATTGVSWGAQAQPNPIINGSMDVWQRGTSFAAVASSAYTADRWQWTNASSVVVTMSQSTNIPTVAQAGTLFNYSLDVDVTTADASIIAGDVAAVQYKMEGSNWRQFAQQPFTLSFWVRDTKTGPHAVAFTNAGFNRSYVATYTINITDTWEYKTVTVSASPSAGTWDYTNGIGLIVRFPLIVGSTYQTTAGAWQTGDFYGTSSTVNSVDSTANFFRVTGIKLEHGSNATPLQFRSFQEEFLLCQRYYQKSFNYATAPVQNVGVATGEQMFTANAAGAVTQSSASIYRGTPMRTQPTITLYNPAAANAQVRNITDAADLTASVTAINSETKFIVQATGTAGTAVGELLAVHWTANAEL